MDPQETAEEEGGSADRGASSAESSAVREGLELVPAGTPGPMPRTYWVVKDRLLAGAYPGAADVAAHEKRIHRLLESGCRTFVDLMEEGETNNAGVAFRPYADRVEEAGAMHLRFAVKDAHAPTEETMKAALDAIDSSLAAGRPVYVHCFGGMGRTGTAVCRWMLRHGLADRAGVLAKLTELRQADVERRDRPAPETRDQCDFVLAGAAAS